MLWCTSELIHVTLVAWAILRQLYHQEVLYPSHAAHGKLHLERQIKNTGLALYNLRERGLVREPPLLREGELEGPTS